LTTPQERRSHLSARLEALVADAQQLGEQVRTEQAGADEAKQALATLAAQTHKEQARSACPTPSAI